MSAKVGFAWFTGDAKIWYMPDLRNLALHHMSFDQKYSGQFHDGFRGLLILAVGIGISISVMKAKRTNLLTNRT